MPDDAKCRHVLGCHGCIVNEVAEYLWSFRQELMHLIQMPQIEQEKIRAQAHHLISQIDAVIVTEWKEKNT